MDPRIRIRKKYLRIRNATYLPVSILFQFFPANICFPFWVLISSNGFVMLLLHNGGSSNGCITKRILLSQDSLSWENQYYWENDVKKTLQTVFLYPLPGMLLTVFWGHLIHGWLFSCSSSKTVSRCKSPAELLTVFGTPLNVVWGPLICCWLTVVRIRDPVPFWDPRTRDSE